MSKFVLCYEAYTVEEFEKHFVGLLLKQPPQCVKFHKYMEKLEEEKHRWARCFFKCERYNILTSNGAESINAVLAEARKLPIVLMLDQIVKLISRWFNNHRNEALEGGSSQLLTPEVEALLHHRRKDASSLKVDELNMITREYYVKQRETSNSGQFYVDLLKKTCSCRVFDIDHIPCAHAIAAFAEHHDEGETLDSMCSEFYSRSFWAMAYSKSVYPVSSFSNWNIPDYIEQIKVAPPHYLKRPGNVQTVRREAGGGKVRKKSKRQKDPCRF